MKIRVAHVCDKFGVSGSSVHGVGRLFSWWMPRFDSTHFDVRLVGLRDRDEGAAAIEREGVEITFLGKGKFDFSTSGALERFAREHEIQVLHLHGYGAANFGRMAARRAGARVVLHEHFVDPGLPLYQHPFDYLLSDRADVGVANCEAVREFMVEKRYVPRDRIEVVFNGVPLDAFQQADPSRVESERQKLGIPDDVAIIGSIGRLDEQKGNKYLVEATAKLLARGQRLKLLIIGDGPLQAELTAQCQSLGIEGDVLFTGYCSDVPLMQSLLDIQVLPSLWEGTTLTVFEAMSVGLPIVSTDADGLREVLQDGHNALLAPPGDASALAAQINRLLDDSAERTRIAVQARGDSSRYDIAATIRRLEEIYANLVGA